MAPTSPAARPSHASFDSGWALVRPGCAGVTNAIHLHVLFEIHQHNVGTNWIIDKVLGSKILVHKVREAF